MYYVYIIDPSLERGHGGLYRLFIFPIFQIIREKVGGEWQAL